MYKQVTEGFYWIQECVKATDTDTLKGTVESQPNWYQAGKEVHGANNAYLITGSENLVFDTASPMAETMVLETIEEILDGETLDYIVVSHHELPHAGNVDSLLDEYPEATLVAASRGIMHDLHGLKNAKLVDDRDTLSLGDYTVEFLEPTIYDTAIHLWMFEHKTETLFTVDWLAAPHLETECLEETHKLDHVIERLVLGNGATLPWLQYVDNSKIKQAIDELLNEYQPSILAPAHGSVTTEQASEFFKRRSDVIETISEQGATQIAGDDR